MSVESLDPVLGKQDELVMEQAYFDRAVAAREDSVAGRMVEHWSAGTAAERRAFAQSMGDSHIDLDENVAFGRMDLEDGEIYYIGKQPIFDEDKNLLVMNWQMPAAAAYNQASARDSQGLLRKRAFDAASSRIRDFQDTVFKELAQAVAELEEWQSPDDALLTSLEERRSGQMHDIVRTIQAAQDKIVRMDKDRLLIVQGGPGTGKTAVALHRVSWLLFNYQDELAPEDVLVVGPNQTFTRYIRRVLPDLGDHDVVQKSLQDLLAPGLSVTGNESEETAALKGMSAMADLIATGLADRIKAPRGPVRIQQRASGRYFDLPAEAVSERISQLRGDVYLEGRARLKEALLELANAEYRRYAPFGSPDVVDPRSLDSAVNQLWPQLTAQQFLRELFGSKERLLRAAAGTDLRARDIELLHRPAAAGIADEPWTAADLALIDEANEALRGAPDIYGHIVVDEAQDLSEMELLAIRRRSRHGSMTVVGDIAQSTGPSAMNDWERVEDMLVSRLPAEHVQLEHGYRVPKEVFDLAAPVLALAAPDVTPPRIVRSAGANPVFSAVPAEELSTELCKVVVHHSGRGRFVGVIAVPELWEQIREAFRAEEIQWSESSSGELSNAINLVTPEASKGLEFDAVIVVDPQGIIDMPHGDRLLYIALTRTTTRLDVIYPAGTLPAVLGGEDTGEPEGSDGVQTGGLGAETASVSVPDDAPDMAKSGLGSSPGITEAPGQLTGFEKQMVDFAVNSIIDEMLSKMAPSLHAAVARELNRRVENG